jgi:type I restriction enzyme R subunit
VTGSARPAYRRMQRLSSNFGFVAGHNHQLDRLGALAERYFSDVPNTCLIKMRQFAELLAQHTAAGVGVVVGEATNFADLLRPTAVRGPAR